MSTKPKSVKIPKYPKVGLFSDYTDEELQNINPAPKGPVKVEVCELGWPLGPLGDPYRQTGLRKPAPNPNPPRLPDWIDDPFDRWDYTAPRGHRRNLPKSRPHPKTRVRDWRVGLFAETPEEEFARRDKFIAEMNARMAAAAEQKTKKENADEG